MDGYQIWGVPSRANSFRAAHALGIPFALGSSEMEGPPQDIAGEPFLFELLCSPEFLRQVARGELRAKQLRTRDVGELARVYREQCAIHRARSGGVSLPTFGYTDDGNPSAMLLDNAPADPDERLRFVAREVSGFICERITYEIARGTYQPRKPRRVRIKKRDVFTFAPDDAIIQRGINALLQLAVAPSPTCSHGFESGRSVSSAMADVVAAFGSGAVFVQTADFKTAFPSINRHRVLERVEAELRQYASAMPLPAGNSRAHIDADAMHLSRLIRFVVESWRVAKDAKGRTNVDVSHVGLLQGAPISPALFNLALRPLDKVSVGKRTDNVWIIRYADNFMVCASSAGKVAAAIQWIENYGRGFGLALKRTSPVKSLADGAAVSWLGLRLQATPTAGLGIGIANSAMQTLASVVEEADSASFAKAAINLWLRHYRRHNWLSPHNLAQLRNLLGQALASNPRLRGCHTAQALVRTLRLQNYAPASLNAAA